jgi:hypothetical protein
MRCGIRSCSLYSEILHNKQSVSYSSNMSVVELGNGLLGANRLEAAYFLCALKVQKYALISCEHFFLKSTHDFTKYSPKLISISDRK